LLNEGESEVSASGLLLTGKLSAFVELEREVLTVTFYLESIQADSCR
jgi:hypothetical protein